MQVTFRASIAGVLLLASISATPLAQSIRDRIRLSKDKQTPITEAQATELTLTLSDVAVRPIQVWVRTAGRIDGTGRTITASVAPMDAGHVKVGQRVRAFPPESRSSMFQAKISKVAVQGNIMTVTATLTGPAHTGSSHYVLEIVTEPLEVLAVPNEAIIEAEGKHVVYVQVEKGRYQPRNIGPGLQGELYTQVLSGLKAGEQVVTFGSFFIDADHQLKGS
ncbi:MAG: hypothetical protein ABL986_20155 [Vicinamibacterales bacterium]